MTRPLKRERASFPSEHTVCVAYIYRPQTRELRNGACVVMAHGFSGTQEGSIAETAQDFAASGFTVLTFDYRGFGESEGATRQAPSIRSQHADWRAAIEFARTLADVRADKIALWGSSLSGGHVLHIAARDPLIAAVISQVPFNGFAKRIEGRTRGETWRLLGVALRDWWGALRGRGRHYIKCVGHPGDLAVIASAQAMRTVSQMQNATWENRVAPGVLIDMAIWYRPGRGARRLLMPTLLSVAEYDKESPPSLTLPIAHRASARGAATLSLRPLRLL